MKTIILMLGTALLLSGCVAGYYGEPAPYYGGVAPYYGTTFVPAYAHGEVDSQYYPHDRAQHIYSHYNNNYWHHQRSAPQTAHAAAPRAGEQHNGRQDSGQRR